MAINILQIRMECVSLFNSNRIHTHTHTHPLHAHRSSIHCTFIMRSIGISKNSLFESGPFRLLLHKMRMIYYFTWEYLFKHKIQEFRFHCQFGRINFLIHNHYRLIRWICFRMHAFVCHWEQCPRGQHLQLISPVISSIWIHFGDYFRFHNSETKNNNLISDENCRNIQTIHHLLWIDPLTSSMIRCLKRSHFMWIVDWNGYGLVSKWP